MKTVSKLFVSVCLLTAQFAQADIPEPDIIFYGRILTPGAVQPGNVNSSPEPVESGNLVWTLDPPAGDPFTVTTPLQLLGDGFVYRLSIPVGLLTVEGEDAGTIRVDATTAQTYGRATVTLDGQPLFIASPGEPEKNFLTFSQAQRGKIERIDLSLGAEIGDYDNDGIPDAVEEMFSSEGIVGAHGIGNGDGDLDGDGESDLDEYLKGNDIYGLTYPQWISLYPSLTGADAAPGADPDNDGKNNFFEFSVDCNPSVPDAAAYNQMVYVSGGVDSAQTFTIDKPFPEKPRRENLSYTVEVATDLTAFGPPNAALVTENDSQLQVVEDYPGGGAEHVFFRYTISDE